MADHLPAREQGSGGQAPAMAAGRVGLTPDVADLPTDRHPRTALPTLPAAQFPVDVLADIETNKLPRPDGGAPGDTARSDPHGDAQRQAPAAPTRPPDSPRRRQTGGITLAAALVLLVLFNVGVQIHRRYFDALGGASDVYGNAYLLYRAIDCEALGRNLDVLYLGSSQTQNNINPIVVDQHLQQTYGQRAFSCNAGMGGGTFEDAYYLFKRMVEDGTVPKVVVETLWTSNVWGLGSYDPDYDPLAFSQLSQLADPGDVWALGAHYGSGPQAWPGELNFLAEKYIPAYGDRAGLYTELCGLIRQGVCAQDLAFAVSAISGTPYDPTRGYIELDGRNWSDVPGPCNCHFVFGGGHQLDYLIETIALARAHHVQFVLVQTPLSVTYYPIEGFAQPADWQMYQTFWDNFARYHGVLYFDHSHAPEETEADFYNPAHLNVGGATKFSAWLAVNVVGPALYPRAPAGRSPSVGRA